MIRIVVTFLVAVQAMLPPGMCLCQFVPFAAITHQAPETVPASPASITAHVDESCCSCAACRSPVATAQPDDRAGTDRDPPPEHHPLPTPTSPCSGCPVVSAGPAARVAILCVPEQAPFDTVVHFVVSTVEAVQPRAARPNLLVNPVAPPLFVRHCALLI